MAYFAFMLLCFLCLGLLILMWFNVTARKSVNCCPHADVIGMGCVKGHLRGAVPLDPQGKGRPYLLSVDCAWRSSLDFASENC